MRPGSVTSRRRLWALLGAAPLLIGASVVWSALYDPGEPIQRVTISEIPQAAPLCPWRAPERELRQFFPGADRWLPETRILSEHRVELARRLGRPPAPDELALLLYHVHRGPEMRGAVMTRRARGKYGAIEVVVAVTPAGSVRGVRLQRLREPAAIARALRSPAWLQGFAGRSAGGDWSAAARTASLPAAARPSAAAVWEAVRSMAILYDVSSRLGANATHPHH
jgi:hypothetical protein